MNSVLRASKSESLLRLSSLRRALLGACVAFCIPASGSGQSTITRWQVATDPVLVIGAERDDAELFQSISGVVALSDGSIAVADHGLFNLRVFDKAGRRITNVGQHGMGPGDFRHIAGIWVTSKGQPLP